jgi:hypothetical protein
MLTAQSFHIDSERCKERKKMHNKQMRATSFLSHMDRGSKARVTQILVKCEFKNIQIHPILLSWDFPSTYLQVVVNLFEASPPARVRAALSRDGIEVSSDWTGYLLHKSTFYMQGWARICKPFKELWNRFPAWRAGTTTLFDVPARHASEFI